MRAFRPMSTVDPRTPWPPPMRTFSLMISCISSRPTPWPRPAISRARARSANARKGPDMAVTKQDILGWIERDREQIIEFLRGFVRAKSPNPPGDTTEAVGYITRFLDAEKLPWHFVAPQPTMANVVGTFEGGGPGGHLVLNGHIDVFPVDESEPWTHDAWSGDLADGKIWGRGVVDMKAGTSASIFTYRYL